jgi:hypothetical protein
LDSNSSSGSSGITVQVTNVDANGNWQFQDSGLLNGVICTYTLWVINGAWVAGGESGRLTLTIDNSGPMPLQNWIHGIGANPTDTATGTAGNDYIGIFSSNFVSVNGGAGWDTLVFEKSGITLNLTSMGARVQGFEQFDLNNQSNIGMARTSGNTLELRLSDILSQPNPPSSSQNLSILGDANSTVHLNDTGWAKSGATQLIGGVSFDVWHNTAQGSSTAADLLIQQGVHVI